jgi:hypothetical protein
MLGSTATQNKSPGNAVTRAGVNKSFRYRTTAIYQGRMGSMKPEAIMARYTKRLAPIWPEESVRAGSDWPSISALHFRICDRLRAGSSSWASSS